MLSVQLVASSGEYPVDQILSGERIRSVRALIQKPSPVWSKPSIDLVASSEVYSHSPFMGGDPVNYFSYFGSMFLAFAGGIRYKYLSVVSDGATGPLVLLNYPLISNAVCNIGSVPLAQFNPTSATGPAGLLVTEATVPYCHAEKWVPAYQENIMVLDAIRLLTPEPDEEVVRALYRCAAPDARLTFFRAQNLWIIRSTPSPDWGTVNIFAEVVNNSTTPPSMARVADKPAVVERQKMTLDQYRARTGRSEFKITPRTIRRENLRKTIPQPILTEDQAIREDAVA